MSAQVIELFEKREAVSVEGEQRRRLWVAPGRPLLIGGAVLTLWADRVDADFSRLRMECKGPAGTEDFSLRPDSYLDLSAHAALFIVPLAARYTDSWRVDEVLIEFVLVDRDRRFVN